MNDIIHNSTQFFEDLKNDFSSLWSIKQRQNTIEFITPYTTIAGEAISVFLTHRDVGYIVSDGGRLFDISKEQDLEIYSSKVHYSEIKEKFAIKETKNQNKHIFFYKIEKDIKMLSAAIYDVAYFQETIANAIYLATYFETDETFETRHFITRVRELLNYKIQILSTDNDKYELIKDDDKIHFLRFAAGIRKVNTDLIWLGMTIHRSNLQNYERSVISADFGFRRANRYFSSNNLSMSAIIDDLPEKLQGNAKSLFLQTEMNEWQKEFNITNLSFNQIDKMNSLQFLFSAA